MSNMHNSSRRGIADNNRRRRGTDVHRVFREFADATSMHGVPRIINAQSVPARIFWSIICFAAFGMFFWQTAILLQRYYSYPKKVNVQIVQRPVQFPWVSVCNTKHLDVLIVERLESILDNAANITDDEDDDDFLGAFQRKYEMFWEYSSFFFQQYLMMNIPWEKTRQDMLEVYSRLGLIANLGPDMASKGGIKLMDFIVSCTFMNEKCNITQVFSKVFDPYYFNCFTFKSGAMQRSTSNRLQGIEYGLSLLLFTGSAGQLTLSSNFDYLVPGVEESDSALASGRGARVVIHSPNTVPHPTAEGFDIAPGFSVTIGVKARENSRISHPHGNCSTSGGEGDHLYTLIGCQNDCLQSNIINTCGCIDNRISVPKKLKNHPYCFELPKMPDECMMDFNVTKCMEPIVKWSNMLKCRKGVYDNMTTRDPDSMDRCNCYPPCSDIVYDSSYSLSTIPERSEEHTAFYTTITAFLELMPQKKKVLLKNKFAHGTQDEMAAHISRLNVHIADSNVIKTTEAPDYEAIRLISDIGGQLGLWIGISVMTLFEVVQLVADVCRFLTAKGRTVGERRMERVPEKDVEMQCEIDKLTAV